MRSFSFFTTLAVLLFSIAASPAPEAIPIPDSANATSIIATPEISTLSLDAALTTTTSINGYITKYYTTTLTSWAPGEDGQGVAIMYTTETISAVQPFCADFPATVEMTYISTITWEVRIPFDSEPTETSFTSATYTDPPVTTVLTAV